MPAAINGFKECSRCHQIKDVGEFSKNKTKKDGLQYACKECCFALIVEYYKNNKEKLAKQKAEYRKNNKEKLTKQKAEYRKNNKEKLTKIRAEWQKNNKEKIRQYGDWIRFGLTSKQSDIVENLRINGKCCCCGRNAKDGGTANYGGQKKLCLDHNHNTGQIRGLLCNNCNSFEGQLKKQLELRTFNINEVPKIWKDYLENPPGIPESKLT